MRFSLFLFGICFLLSSSLFAQSVYQKVSIEVSNKKTDVYENLDSVSLVQIINKKMQNAVSQGFLFARVERKELGNRLDIKIKRGSQYDKIAIDSVQGSNSFYEVNSLKQLEGKQLGIAKLNRFLEKAIARLNNNGYPFAKIELLPNFRDNSVVGANLKVKENALVSFDTVIILGDLKLSRSFVKHYFGIEKGKPFDESVFRSLKKRIEVLDFISLEQDPFVLFQKNKARVYLRLKETKANNINALIGFAPQSENNDNKLLLTGQADIKLVNLTKNRENIELHWRNFLGNSQSLQTIFETPYLPYLGFGLGARFDLTKFDSNYLQTELEVNTTFLGKNGLQWKVSIESENTSLLNADTNGIRSSFSFPVINANRRTAYGLTMAYENWDNIFNPSKGFSFEAGGTAGRKRIVKDARIERIIFEDGSGNNYTLYDSLELDFIQYQAGFDVEYVLPIYKNKWVVFNKIQGQSNWAPQLFFNDLYRLGGFSSLRGFDEQSIFAAKYLSSTIELRYRIDNFSNFFLFLNGLAYQTDINNYTGPSGDIPYGFGLGANINTQNTTLQMAYAYGQQQGNKINLRQGKFHFGLVNYF